MPRNAVRMSQDEFESLLLIWASALEQEMDKKEGHLPESVEETARHLAEEARDAAKYGAMYVLDMKIHNALMACVELNNMIIKDLSKVNFDWENCGCDLERDTPCGFWTTAEGVPTLGCYAGGDWEDPVYFVLYPETKTKIRAYMPKAGNTWNVKNKTAWGSGDGDEDADENPRKVDVNAFRTDVAVRIVAKG
jgi:hypothetical protein